MCLLRGPLVQSLNAGALAGVPFRETHHLSGAAVKMAEDKGCSLSDLTHADLSTIHPLLEGAYAGTARHVSHQSFNELP